MESDCGPLSAGFGRSHARSAWDSSVVGSLAPMLSRLTTPTWKASGKTTLGKADELCSVPCFGEEI